MKNIAIVMKKGLSIKDKEKVQKAVKKTGFVVSKDPEFILVVGGDGTILEAEMSKAKGKPILAINAGDLGFLAEDSFDGLETALSMVKQNKFIIDERSKLCFSVNMKKVGEALNEVIIVNKHPGKALRAKAYIDGNKAFSVICDNILVSTPTGSTGYSMSAGGSVMEPHTNTFSVMAVNQHLSSVPPLIIHDEREVKIVVGPQDTEFCAVVDGMHEIPIKAKQELSIKKSKNKAKLIKLGKPAFFKKLSCLFS